MLVSDFHHLKFRNGSALTDFIENYGSTSFRYYTYWYSFVHLKIKWPDSCSILTFWFSFVQFHHFVKKVTANLVQHAHGQALVTAIVCYQLYFCALKKIVLATVFILQISLQYIIYVKFPILFYKNFNFLEIIAIL